MLEAAMYISAHREDQTALPHTGTMLQYHPRSALGQ